MFVSDSSLFSATTMKIRVCGMGGTDVILDVNPDASVDKVKIAAVGGVSEPGEHMQNSLYFKLINVRSGKVLSEDSTISKEDVQENDELLLVRKRMPPPNVVDPSASKKDDSRAGPTLDQIQKATESLPSKHMDREESNHVDNVDFQSELKKILITLIEAAQKLLCLNPEAAKIFQDAEDDTSEEAEESPATPHINPIGLQQLVDMGFPDNRARKALLVTKMSTSDAIQWLLEHESDTDIDSPIPARSPVRSPKPENAQPLPGTSSKGPGNFTNLLQSFKAIRRRQFKPNKRILSNLVEMGFDEADAIDALRISSNKEGDACDWLLSGRPQETETDLEVGLDPESSLYKAILSNPVVQLGLSNPKNLNALFQMYENMDSTKQWLNDPDTGPMLIQISRIYHAEKHSHTSSSPSSTRGSASGS